MRDGSKGTVRRIIQESQMQYGCKPKYAYVFTAFGRMQVMLGEEEIQKTKKAEIEKALNTRILQIYLADDTIQTETDLNKEITKVFRYLEN